MTDIDKQRANRLLVMNAIYDASDGSEGNAVSGPHLLGTLGLSDQELGDACKYLEGEHLIRGTRTLWSHLTPFTIHITHRGIKEIEESLQAPDEATAHFPPAVSVIHVQGDLIGSPIQSGSPGAQQEMTVRDINREGTTEETLPLGIKEDACVAAYSHDRCRWPRRSNNCHPGRLTIELVVACSCRVRCGKRSGGSNVCYYRGEAPDTGTLGK